MEFSVAWCKIYRWRIIHNPIIHKTYIHAVTFLVVQRLKKGHTRISQTFQRLQLMIILIITECTGYFLNLVSKMFITCLQSRLHKMYFFLSDQCQKQPNLFSLLSNKGLNSRKYAHVRTWSQWMFDNFLH